MSAAGEPVGNQYAITLEQSGILYFHIRKVLSAQDADDFYAELAPTHEMARRRYGRVLTLARVSVVQSPIVALRVRSLTLAIKQPGDRHALLIGTMLAKLQMGRLGTHSTFQVFGNEDQAREWLLAP